LTAWLINQSAGAAGRFDNLKNLFLPRPQMRRAEAGRPPPNAVHRRIVPVRTSSSAPYGWLPGSEDVRQLPSIAVNADSFNIEWRRLWSRPATWPNTQPLRDGDALAESYADPRSFAPNHVAGKNSILSDQDQREIIWDDTLWINVQSRTAVGQIP
jgi:hypothetical protein